MIVPVPQFTAPAYNGLSANDVDRCFNFYNASTPDGPVLVSRPGLTLFTTATNNLPCKGLYMTGDDRLFAVHGTKLYEINSAGTVTDRGTLSGLGDFVEMADNGIHLMIRGDSAGWTFTLSGNTLAQITDVNYPATTRGLAFRDSVFIVASYPTGRIYVSQLLDGTDWTPVSFATAEAKSDPLGGLASVGSNLYLIGSRTTETWYNTGNPAFTFQPINGGQIDVGVYYPWSIATLFDSVYFVSQSQGKQAIWSIGAGGPRKISTPYIDEQILGMTNIRGLAFSDSGNSFYVLSGYAGVFKSYAYNITNGTWSEWGSTMTTPKQWRVSSISPGFSGTEKILCGDYENGKIYYLSGNDDGGIDIVRQRIFGPIASNGKRIFHNQIRFEYEVKFDSAGTTSVAPLLAWSDDGGLTYSSSRTMTKTVTSTTTGQRVTSTENRLGSSTERYYRETFSGGLTGRIILKKCELDLQEGRF